MKVMLLESPHASNIFFNITGLNTECPEGGWSLDVGSHIINIMLGVGEECLFDRSLYGEENLYNLTDEIDRAFGARLLSGSLIDSVLLIDQRGTVAVIFGE